MFDTLDSFLDDLMSGNVFQMIAGAVLRVLAVLVAALLWFLIPLLLLAALGVALELVGYALGSLN